MYLIIFVTLSFCRDSCRANHRLLKIGFFNATASGVLTKPNSEHLPRVSNA